MTSLLSKPVRIACLQWPMQALTSVQPLLDRITDDIRDMARYGCDLVVLPELFSLPLLALHASPSSRDAMCELAAQTPVIVDHCEQLARSHHINIICGSLPSLEDNQLFNVAFFCHRNGSPSETQYKLHPTPYEKQQWNMQGGQRLKVIESDIGKIGILICYDVEFPELARLLADDGMQILCVPFWTDSLTGYHRVRYCAQARAIEDECFVALAGSCGLVPAIAVMDTQHAQSAIFTPADLSFPEHAVLAEADANRVMPVVADLDLDKLTALRENGAVQNSKDRRRDLYRIAWLGTS